MSVAISWKTFAPATRADQMLFASPRAEDLLAENGLVDLESVFACGEALQGARAAAGSRHPNRGVVRFRLREEGSQSVVFIKKQWRRERWLPSIRELRDGTAGQSLPEREWHGLNLARSVGLDAAEPLALFMSVARSCCSAIVIRAVPPEHDLHVLATSGQLHGLSCADRHALADAVANLIRTIHESGCGWLSLKPKHLFPQRQTDGQWRIWIIDCEGFYARPPARQTRAEAERFFQALRKPVYPAEFAAEVSQFLLRKPDQS